ncbi:MAG: diol dehydratase small subunit [Hyphomicrobium sp.]|nr:diol dehydratase small subunit [Hyphomicrobium sp.]
MTAKRPLSKADYPLAEKRPEIVHGRRGKDLQEVTLAAVLDDRVTMEDLRITATALLQQAEIARDAGRATLAENFARAADLVDVPSETIFRVYELLRPGRAPSKAALTDAARELRDTYGASRMADFVDEAAEIYESRGLFKKRF